MHLLETYALNCGAKIDKPFIYTTYFPMPIEKYITFVGDETEPAKNYDYWQDVINILNPALEATGIKIVQLGEANSRNFSDCIDLRGQLNPNQAAHIIKNSMLHMAPDGFSLQVAGSFDVPLVGLYSVVYSECCKPYFGSPEKQRAINAYSKTDKKPSFAAEEPIKTINLIKPEEIATAVLELLGIDFPIPFETVYVGAKYGPFVIEESIPTSPAVLFNPEHQVEVRTDLGVNDDALANQLANYKKVILVVERPLNMNILSHFRNNIHSIVFKISGADQKEFLKQIIDLGKPLILISHLTNEQIQELKPIYYEFGAINKIEPVSEEIINNLKKEVDRLYYRSAKVTGVNGKYHYSQAAAENGVPMMNHHEYQKVIDTPSFWENLHCFTIVRVRA